ncbi:hypothetical protein Tco_0914900 [Tanacetum coccineum]
MDTKFAKPSILGKPVLQPPKNQSVVRQSDAFKSERPKPRFASQVDVNNVLSKPVTPHYLPKVKESVFVKPHHVIASGSSRNSSKESYGSNDMAHNYYLDEAKKKTQDKNMNLKPREMPSARTHHTPNACGDVECGDDGGVSMGGCGGGSEGDGMVVVGCRGSDEDDDDDDGDGVGMMTMELSWSGSGVRRKLQLREDSIRAFANTPSLEQDVQNSLRTILPLSLIIVHTDEGLMTRKYFIAYTKTDVPLFHDKLIQHMEFLRESIQERAKHKREYDRRMNNKMMQSKEGKVDSSKALDADLVVTESNETKSERHVSSSRPGKDINARDMHNINSVNDKQPMAEVQLFAEHNIRANEQQHAEQFESVYDTYVLEKVDRNTIPKSMIQ